MREITSEKCQIVSQGSLNATHFGGGNQTSCKCMVVVSNMFLLSPLPGEMIQFDAHMFQMGWFNHQLEMYGDFQAW